MFICGVLKHVHTHTAKLSLWQYLNSKLTQREKITHLPIVLSTSKPNPFEDFPALCISASFLPSSAWWLKRTMNPWNLNIGSLVRISSFINHLAASWSKIYKLHDDIRSTCWQCPNLFDTRIYVTTKYLSIYLYTKKEEEVFHLLCVAWGHGWFWFHT